MFSGAADEGNSGGPLLRNGQVVGVVTAMTAQYGYAVPSAIVQLTLEGWRIGLIDESPPIDARRYVPSLDAHATSLRFFKGIKELTPKPPPASQRVYEQRFPKDARNSFSSNIFWELGLKHPVKDQKIAFVIDWDILNEDETFTYRSRQGSTIERTLTHTNHPGLITPQLKPGRYKILISIDRKLIATGTLEIY